MSSPAKGRADYWNPGDWNVLCYQCGRKRKAGELLRYWQGYWVCPEHWEPRQPQDFVRAVSDVQTPPWVQPPGLDGIPQLFITVDESTDSYDVTVSTATISAVNDTLVIITILEGVYIGVLDLTGLSAGWTVQLNSFGGVGVIIGTATVHTGPPKKHKPPQIDPDASSVAASPVSIDVLPDTSDVTVTLLDINGSPVADVPVTLSSTPAGTINPVGVLTNGSGQAVFTFGSDTPDAYVISALVGDAVLTDTTTVSVGGVYTLTSAHYTDTGVESYGFDDDLGGGFGGIDPSTLDGTAFTSFATIVTIPSAPSDGFFIALGGLVAQSFWASVTINGTTLLSSAATYLQAAGQTVWLYPGVFPFAAAGEFQVTFT